jgi:lipopolysaccharide transport system permease protein
MAVLVNAAPEGPRGIRAWAASQALWKHRSLTLSLARRDIQARYRGSFGGSLWTVIQPLLLMLTYYFVFGVVLEARFPGDSSREGFVLYFLAGMLPWLAMSETWGRSPNLIPEHGSLAKKMVFPVEILPIVRVLAALAAEGVALLLLLALMLITGRRIPLAAAWLPVLLVPQLLLTAGLSYFLAATGAFVRDLAQIIGLILTLLFFLTPICYPESSLPPVALKLQGLNPVYGIVQGYRRTILEGNAPDAERLVMLWVAAAVIFLLGKRWFNRLQGSFADVI